MNESKICVTRAIKNAKHIQRIASHIIPREEPLEGFSSIIPYEVLARIHATAKPDEITGNK